MPVVLGLGAGGPQHNTTKHKCSRFKTFLRRGEIMNLLSITIDSMTNWQLSALAAGFIAGVIMGIALIIGIKHRREK